MRKHRKRLVNAHAMGQVLRRIDGTINATKFSRKAEVRKAFDARNTLREQMVSASPHASLGLGSDSVQARSCRHVTFLFMLFMLVEELSHFELEKYVSSKPVHY